ncbi:MAG TPA: hypothetical protein VIG45_07445 [Erysipelothrix sp.]
MEEKNHDLDQKDNQKINDQSTEIDEILPEDNTDEIEYIEVEAEFYETDDKSKDEPEINTPPEIERKVVERKVKKKRPKTKTKIKNKKNNKKVVVKERKNKSITLLLLSAVLIIGGYFIWNHFYAYEVIDPFSLVSVKVMGTDGNGTIEIEKNGELSKEKEDIYHRIRYEVEDNGTFHKNDKAKVRVILEDEKWFKDNKIKLDPLEEIYTVDFLVDKVVFNWPEYIDYQFTYQRMAVKIDRLTFNQNVPEELSSILNDDKLKTDKKEYDFKDTAEIILELKPNDYKLIHEAGYEIEGTIHQVLIDDFTYSPKYFEDIPQEELLKESALAALQEQYVAMKEANLERICYRLDEQASLNYLYSFKDGEEEKMVAVAVSPIIGIGHELDIEKAEIKLQEVEGIASFESEMKKAGYTCVKP